MKAKISLVDVHGTVVSDVFPNTPMEIDADMLRDEGAFYVNDVTIDFGEPSREIEIEKFIITPGIGFFESAQTADIGVEPITFEENMSVVMDPGALEVQKEILDG